MTTKVQVLATRTDDVLQLFESMIDEAAKANGGNRMQALKQISSENEQLHREYVAALQHLSPSQVAVRRERQAAGALATDVEPAGAGERGW